MTTVGYGDVVPITTSKFLVKKDIFIKYNFNENKWAAALKSIFIYKLLCK
jgi:hypothetical protein